jgi:hypothetical protein
MKRRVSMGLFATSLLLVASSIHPVRAQTEVFSAASISEQGGQYTLVIFKTGSRLRFEISAVSAQSSMSGLPRCDSVDLRPDGTFLSHCSGFQPQDPGRYRLEGSLTAARIDTVFRFGRAEFKLSPGPLAVVGKAKR